MVRCGSHAAAKSRENGISFDGCSQFFSLSDAELLVGSDLRRVQNRNRRTRTSLLAPAGPAEIRGVSGSDQTLTTKSREGRHLGLDHVERIDEARPVRMVVRRLVDDTP